MTVPMQDAFSFWEADLTGEPITDVSRPACGALALALELQTADWTEEEAGAELARRCDARSLHTAQEALLGAFQNSPVLLVKAICASRALWVALDIVEPPSAPARTSVPKQRWGFRRASRRGR